MSIDNVLDNPSREQYVATAAQTVFPYPFAIFAQGDLAVYVDDVLQVLTTDYTVDGVGDDTGGNVTFVTPMAGGEVVTVYRDTAIARTSDIQQNGPQASSTINDEFDRIYIVLQELKTKIGRAIRFPFTADISDTQTELSPLSSWYGKFLRVSSAGILEAAELVSSVVALTQSVIGELLNPQTQAEVAALVTPTNYAYEPGESRRQGDTGDGTTNDSAAIQNTIDGMHSGGEVRIRSGTHLVTGDILEVDKPLVVIGEPGTIIKLDTSGSSLRAFRVTATSGKVVFKHITIDLNQAASESHTNIAVDFSGACSFEFDETCQIINSASSAFGAANRGYGIYCTGSYGDLLCPAYMTRIMYCVITEPSSNGRNITTNGMRVYEISGDALEVNVPTGSCESVSWVGGRAHRVGSNNVGRGFVFGASGDVRRYIFGLIDCDEVDNQCVHLEDGLKEGEILTCTHNNFGNGAAISFGAAIYAAATATAMGKLTIHPQSIKAASGSDYIYYFGGSVGADMLTIMDQQFDGNGMAGPGMFIGSVWQNVTGGALIGKNCGTHAFDIRAKDVQVKSIRAYDDQGTKTQDNGLRIDGTVRRFQVDMLNLRGNTNIGIAKGPTSFTKPLPINAQMIEQIDDVAASAGASSSYQSLFDLGVGAYGTLAMGVEDGSDYATRLYIIDWDGTTLTLTEISANASGVLAISATPSTALQMSGNIIQGKYFNGDAGARTADITATWRGTILFK